MGYIVQHRYLEVECCESDQHAGHVFASCIIQLRHQELGRDQCERHGLHVLSRGIVQTLTMQSCLGDDKVAYKWTDGANACKPSAKPAAATTAASNTCAVCGSVKKSRKKSCCGRGGSWFRNCGSAGNKKFGHTWFEGIQACKQWVSSKRSAAAAYQIMNAAEKYLFNFANNTAKPSHTNTPAEPTTTTPATTKVVTTAAAPITTTTTTRIATFAAKKTPLPTTEWIENDEFYEGFGVSGSVSFVMSHLCAMFSIFVILLE